MKSNVLLTPLCSPRCDHIRAYVCILPAKVCSSSVPYTERSLRLQSKEIFAEKYDADENLSQKRPT